MKRSIFPNEPWFTWSDGRAFTKAEAKKFRFVLRSPKVKVKGESVRQRFERCRAQVEKYEAAQKSILVTEPGLISRTMNWLRGKPSGVTLAVRR